MDHKELTDTIAITIREYIGNSYNEHSDFKLRINPDTLSVSVITENQMLSDIEDSNEAIEDAAAAERAESKEAADLQASRNPDFYPIKDFIKISSGGKMDLDYDAIDSLARKYCGD